MKEITYVDRYGTYTGDYVYYVHYENGDIDQECEETMPKEVRMWIGKSEGFQFRRNKRGEYYHRFTA